MAKIAKRFLLLSPRPFSCLVVSLRIDQLFLLLWPKLFSWFVVSAKIVQWIPHFGRAHSLFRRFDEGRLGVSSFWPTPSSYYVVFLPRSLSGLVVSTKSAQLFHRFPEDRAVCFVVLAKTPQFFFVFSARIAQFFRRCGQNGSF